MPRRHFPLVLIIVAYVIVALGFNLVVPVGESPDEPTHLEYVYYLRQNRALPHLSLPGGTGITQGGHPPLYYLLGAALTFWAPAESPERVTNPHFTFNMETMQAPNAFVHVREAPFPYSGQPEVLAVHVARLISLLAGVVTIISAYLIGRTVLPSRPYVAWGAAALVAFLPGYVFFGGVFNNDTLAIAFAALALLGAVRVAVGKDSPRDLLILGTILGLGLMTKMTTVWLVGIAGLGVLAAAWRARDWRVLGRAMLYVGVPVAILSGWWIVRNMRLYGVDDPMAWRMFLAAGPDLLRDIPLRDELGAYFRLQYMSFWGSFGWTTIRLPEPVYSALAVIPILGVAGLAILVARRDRLVAENRWGLVLLGIAVVVGYLSAFRLALVFNMVAAHGRYLYPALAPMAVLAAVGLGEPFPESWRRWVLAFVALSLLVLTVASLVWLVRPAFALPAVVTPEDAPQIEHRLDVVFDDRIRLLGYDLSTDRVSAGQPLTVTLYWQATDANWEPFPAVTAAEIGFAHLVDAEGEVVAGVDVAPFGG
ncbi:MAG: glycosyltransferase family 39 protein, partial [Anaerolineae bacterium]